MHGRAPHLLVQTCTSLMAFGRASTEVQCSAPLLFLPRGMNTEVHIIHKEINMKTNFHWIVTSRLMTITVWRTSMRCRTRPLTFLLCLVVLLIPINVRHKWHFPSDHRGSLLCRWHKQPLCGGQHVDIERGERPVLDVPRFAVMGIAWRKPRTVHE